MIEKDPIFLNLLSRTQDQETSSVVREAQTSDSQAKLTLSCTDPPDSNIRRIVLLLVLYV